MDSAWRIWCIWCIMYGHWVVNGYGVFVLETETDGRAVGYAGPFRPEGFPENEIGWTIWNEIDEGNGFAEEATRSVLDYCREDLGWTEIVSYIVPSLSRAVSFAIKMGAVLDAAASKPAWEPDALVYRYLK
jgi:RimJ/RimL family protein N-acetyltransferase